MGNNCPYSNIKKTWSGIKNIINIRSTVTSMPAAMMIDKKLRRIQPILLKDLTTIFRQSRKNFYPETPLALNISQHIFKTPWSLISLSIPPILSKSCRSSTHLAVSLLDLSVFLPEFSNPSRLIYVILLLLLSTCLLSPVSILTS